MSRFLVFLLGQIADFCLIEDHRLGSRRSVSLTVISILSPLTPRFLFFAFLVSAAMFSVSQEAAAEGSEPTLATKKIEQTIVFIGDSLAQGYGVRKNEAFPELVESLLKEQGYHVKVVNGGISGSVSADADRRLAWFLKLKPPPAILVLELGGNDALKGTPVEKIKQNLERALILANKNNLKVLLTGMQVYSNLGAAYTREFANMYVQLAHEQKVNLMPFLLANVALKKELNQSDMKHPNAAGHRIIAENLVERLKPMLGKPAQGAVK